ncbi:MAG: DUF7657 domain-containing protein [Rhodoglobus sp.]
MHEVSLRARFSRAIEDFVTPRLSGLPTWKVVTWFPALLVLGSIVLIALRISGSSSGAHWAYFGTGEDPNLLLGYPRGIRSDEWFVHQAWVISQIQQGFPIINQTLPGGMDVSVALEVPVWEWSALFRPHIWGYFLFGADSGLAWEWWIPAIALVAGAYLLVVSYVPRRPFMAAVLACSVFFTPIFQWWYGMSSIYPAAWALLALAGTRWILRDERQWVRVAWSVGLGWFAVTMSLGLYAPFIIPAVFVFLFSFVGSVLNERPWTKPRLADVFRRISPLIVAGIAAVGIFAFWMFQRIETVDKIVSTVYPGQRLALTGQMWDRDPFMTWFGGAVWGQTFRMADGVTALGPNPSESSTVILLALFLIPTLVYLLVRQWKTKHQINWHIVSILAVDALFLAYLFIPGWDAVAHILFLDRMPLQRVWLGFVVLLPLTVAVVLKSIDESKRQLPLWLVAATVIPVLIFHALLLWRIVLVSPEVLWISPLWPIALAGLLAACVFFLRRGRAIWGALSMLVISLVIAGNVNPIYVGAFDLRETETGQTIMELDESREGTWLGVGSQETMALLMETGVEAYNGVQIYPPEELWNEVDPDGDDEQSWNRLGHIQWQLGKGEPKLTSPQVDVVRGTFDACSKFAQENVDYFLTDQSVPDESCLRLVRVVKEANLNFQIFDIVRDGDE